MGRAGCRRPHGAFTLLEVLMVLALMGLLAGVLVTGATRLLQTGPQTPRQMFWDVVGKARREALQKTTQVVMRFDDKAGALVATAVGGQEVARQVLEKGAKCEFVGATAGGNAMLLGGVRVETSTIPQVTFYEDGSCTAFRAQLRGAVGAVELLAIDPWTCTPLWWKETP